MKGPTLNPKACPRTSQLASVVRRRIPMIRESVYALASVCRSNKQELPEQNRFVREACKCQPRYDPAHQYEIKELGRVCHSVKYVSYMIAAR
jgi:hypothetical protein